ncbi:hypothetical protein [Microcoleus sp. B4-D4]|uniref:hypothetical protein n=1 Tax=Microcoleus sp. B4-D4 TaxID=2818667 RepID=UPI002FD4756A
MSRAAKGSLACRCPIALALTFKRPIGASNKSTRSARAKSLLAAAIGNSFNSH